MPSAAPIEFVAQEEGPGEQAIANDVDRAKQRAEKYGLPLDEKKISRTPGMVRDAARKQAALDKASGIITGFDMYDEAEVQRQQRRAARFGTTAPQPQIEMARPSEEEEARKARAAKYGTQYSEPDPSGQDSKILLEERREADPEAALRPEALHVYGVDLIGTKDVLNFFSSYGPTYVEWIDDSSCNVLFPDEHTVKRVLVQMGEAISNEEAASMQSGISPSDESAQKLWYRAKTALMKQGVAVPLLFRIAFTSDAKNWMKQHKTRRLWQMPVRHAVAVAQGKAELPEAPNVHRTKRHSGHKAKRDQMDQDGDAVMDGQQPRGRGTKRRQKVRSEDEVAGGAPPHSRGESFLADSKRQDGAHSYFLNEGMYDADVAADSTEQAEAAHAAADASNAEPLAAAAPADAKGVPEPAEHATLEGHRQAGHAGDAAEQAAASPGADSSDADMDVG